MSRTFIEEIKDQERKDTTQDVATAAAQGEVDSLEAVVDAGVKVAVASLAGGAANAFAFAWQNPESTPIIVQRVIVDRTAAGGTATAVLDIGTAADGVTGSDNLIDGLDANATGIADNITSAGSNGKSRQRLDAKNGTTDYITGQIKTEAAASLAGKVYIEYIKVRA